MGHRVVHRRLSRPVGAHDDEVGELPGFSDPIRASMPNARAPPMVAIVEGFAGRDHRRIVRHQLVQERRLPHRLEHVEIVVAGRPVGARARASHLPSGTPAPAPCRWRASCCSRGCARRPRHAPAARPPRPADPDAVRGERTRGPELDAVQERRRALLVAFLRNLHLVLGFCQVDQERDLILQRQVPRGQERRLLSVYIECGATAGVTRVSPLNRVMNASVRARPSSGVLASGDGELDDGLPQDAADARLPSSPRRPPPRSSTCRRRVVVPGANHLQRRQPRPDPHELGRDGLGLGREDVLLSQSISTRSSARPRYSTIGACVCVLIRPGSTIWPVASMRSRPRTFRRSPPAVSTATISCVPDRDAARRTGPGPCRPW